MNKIKPKANTWQQFSPWQENFRDLYKTLELSTRRKVKNKLSTISPTKQALDLSQKQSSNHQLNRTLLNMSKINLQAGHHCLPEPAISESKRYLGPRITFYAKMNPRANRSKSSFQIDQDLLQEAPVFKAQLTGRLVRDESIKYLDIIEEDLPCSTKHGSGQQYILPKLCNNHALQRVKSKKNEQHHAYLRRLKILYNSRKH